MRIVMGVSREKNVCVVRIAVRDESVVLVDNSEGVQPHDLDSLNIAVIRMSLWMMIVMVKLMKGVTIVPRVNDALVRPTVV
jgi:hypothetical protein